MPIDISSRLQSTPTPGYFYTIVYGDTLLGVAGRAYGLAAGSAARLEAARGINDGSYNSRFRGQPSNLFPAGQLSFSPRFIGDVNLQAQAADGCPAGHSFATLWIPLVAGDEPALTTTVNFLNLPFLPEFDADDLLDPTVFHNGDNLYHYKVKDGDSLASIADALDIAWEELAIVNWGTDDVAEINEYLGRYFVCKKKVGNNYCFSAEDSPGILLLPYLIDDALLKIRRVVPISRHLA